MDCHPEYRNRVPLGSIPEGIVAEVGKVGRRSYTTTDNIRSLPPWGGGASLGRISVNMGKEFISSTSAWS